MILIRVVTDYIATGHPVGSKALVESGGVDASASTVRYELAELESRGLLDHPHTSAGRVPTDAGYRLYAEGLLEQPLGAAQLPIDLSQVRNEVDAALRNTTEMMSQVTTLLAVVTAPPLETTEIRHVEVLLLQPRVVMVVVITSTGGVTKRIFPFEQAVDAKLIEWANAYLNEQMAGVSAGRTRRCASDCSIRAWAPRAGVPGDARAGLHRARAAASRPCTWAAPRG